MKPTEVKSSIYIDFGVENNNKVLKFEVWNQLIILNYKNIFAKGYPHNWSEEFCN